MVERPGKESQKNKLNWYHHRTWKFGLFRCHHGIALGSIDDDSCRIGCLVVVVVAAVGAELEPVGDTVVADVD